MNNQDSLLKIRFDGDAGAARKKRKILYTTFLGDTPGTLWDNFWAFTAQNEKRETRNNILISLVFLWRARQDSNLRPTA